jgi:hypothetical protein
MQKEDDRFALDHGGVALYGDKEKPALLHQLGGHVVHTTAPEQPLVHMVCWEQKEPCKMAVDARVTVAGDEKSPVHVRMHHHFENEHHQTLKVNPLEHGLNVNSTLSEPIHHALQMRTPLQLRFCNPWHVASDYIMEIRLGKNQLISLRLTGATVAKPQPCEDVPCPPPANHPSHP